MIVKINGLHIICIVMIIQIFDVKVMNAIYPRVYTSMHYGIYIVYIKHLILYFSQEMAASKYVMLHATKKNMNELMLQPNFPNAQLIKNILFVMF